MKYKTWILCPDCDYFGIRTILEDKSSKDKFWICPYCEIYLKTQEL